MAVGDEGLQVLDEPAPVAHPGAGLPSSILTPSVLAAGKVEKP